VDRDRFQRVREIFHAVRELDGAEQEEALRSKCGEDEELLSEVRRLFDERGSRFLETPAFGAGFSVQEVTQERRRYQPEEIGRYRILREIGVGGMGIVYLGEQDSPRRRVALKVIRPGVMSRRQERRFEFEAEVLGRLSHPGIAQIFEAGGADTEIGWQPFFAMEYVEGQGLLDHAREHDLDTRGRLELIVQVCEAIHHAHQKGVIHRDLKPQNLLVDATGRVRVLDFGVARATEADLQVTTVHTEARQIVGTIPYMSPEQVEGDPSRLDTRSDVYAIGAVAYELLSGELPHDLLDQPLAAAARTITTRPVRPLGSHTPSLRGELETIVHKALEPDRDRRYQSASDLGADIQRYLRDEPILARPASSIYQLRKFARRNRGLVFGACALVLAVALGLGAVLWALVNVSGAEEEARNEARSAEKVVDYLVDLLWHSDPLVHGRVPTVVDLLQKASSEVDVVFADRPQTRYELRMTLGQALGRQSRNEEAEGELVAGVEVARALYGDADERTLRARNALAAVRNHLGRSEEALAEFRRVGEQARDSLGLAHGLTLDSMQGEARCLGALGELRASEELLGEVLALRREHHPGEVLALVEALVDHADVLMSLDYRDEARSRLEEAYGIDLETLGEDHTYTIRILRQLGLIELLNGNHEEAVSFAREQLARQRRNLGDDHPETLAAMEHLAGTLMATGKHREALQMQQRVVDATDRRFGGDHPSTLDAEVGLALTLKMVGRHDEALERLADVTRRAEAVHPADSLDLAIVRMYHGELLRLTRHHDQAEEQLLAAYEVIEAAVPEGHPIRSQVKRNLEFLYRKLGEPTLAEHFHVEPTGGQGLQRGEAAPAGRESEAP